MTGMLFALAGLLFGLSAVVHGLHKAEKRLDAIENQLRNHHAHHWGIEEPKE
jgi:hypothetical protein